MFQSGKNILSPQMSDMKLLNITLIDENIFYSIPSDMLSNISGAQTNTLHYIKSFCNGIGGWEV